MTGYSAMSAARCTAGQVVRSTVVACIASACTGATRRPASSARKASGPSCTQRCTAPESRISRTSASDAQHASKLCTAQSASTLYVPPSRLKSALKVSVLSVCVAPPRKSAKSS